MATKYFLQSGGLKEQPAKAKAFHRAIVGNLKEPKILICIFAQMREVWEEKFPKYSEAIKRDLPSNVKPVFMLAMPDTFKEDCREADIIYCLGGDDQLAMWRFGAFDLPKIWDGKIVSTNSASTDMLAESFWTCDWRKCMNGLNVLPLKFIPHFKSNWGNDDPRGPIDWGKAHQELEDFGDTSLPIHALEEGVYIVIEQ
jgi:hypothetical protein